MLKKLKRNLPLVLFIVLFVTGFLVMAYPVISNAVSEVRYDETIKDYENTVKKKSNEEYEYMFHEAEEYNKNLTHSTVADVFSDPNFVNSEEYLDILKLDDHGTIGYLSIPKIDVKIPIYHGTSAEVLQKGVGHLEGSSFPVGGETTHAILSAHRGLPSARLFTDLDKMEEGDFFYIYVLDRVFTYQVDQIMVIEPDNTEPLGLKEGQDYVTLITCTPYGVNTHRLLVRGTRVVPEEEEHSPVVVEETPKVMSTFYILLYVGIGIGILVLVITILIVLKMKKNKEKHLKTDHVEHIEKI